MRLSTPQSSAHHKAFSLIELLIVIAVIGIMSALVISAFSGASQDTRRVIARQQQAAVQNAVNAWVNFASEEFFEFDPGGSPGRTKKRGLIGAQNLYNTAPTARERLTLISDYLDLETFEHLVGTGSGQIQTLAMRKTGQFITLDSWVDASFPKVELITP